MNQVRALRELGRQFCDVDDPTAIRACLERVLDTQAFRRAPRMQRFLTFLIDELIAGRAQQLKEYTIAIGVFDKPVDFDPGTSAVIRVEAGRLRRMLENYRLAAGPAEDLELEIPKGSYVPAIRFRTHSHEPESGPPQAAEEQPGWLASDERRLVTILACAFCDERASGGYSVSSDLLQWFDRFHQLALEVAGRHNGTVDGAASDRMLIYFGWPEALEDAAGRALTAALELIEAAREDLNAEGIGVRIGVATSEVVIRATSASVEGAPSVIGPAPLIASAMLQHSPLNGVLASETTRQLVGNAFDFVPAGSIDGRNQDPALLWRLIGTRVLTTRYRAHHGADERAIVGRRDEIGLLRGKWSLSAASEGQVVAIVGEAGVGKSMLAETVAGELDPHGVLRMQCSPHHSNSALYPFVELLRQIVPEDEEPDCAGGISRFLAEYGLLGEEELGLLGALLSRSESAEIAALPASRQKDLTLRLLTRWLSARAARTPSLMIVEDLHWSDPTTLELLQDVAHFGAELPLMLLLTSRQEIGADFARQTNFTSLRLSRLPKGECNELISRMASSAELSADMRDAILERAEGIPLFIEELTRLYLGLGVKRSDASVPASLSDLLSSQLGRLGSARAVAQMAAVIGRQFDRATVELATGRPADEIEGALDRLLAAGIVVRSPASNEAFQFRHALLRDASYESIVEQRRRELHNRVAGILIERFPDIAANHPEVVAGHLVSAGEHGEAFPFWVDAGAKAASRYALLEAAHAYQRALDAISRCPSGRANSERELDVLISLGQVLRSARGYGDEELLPIYDRARDLAARLGNRRQLANAVYGLWTHAAGQGKWPDAVEIAEEFSALTSEFEDSQFEVEARRLLGASAAFRGEFALAGDHFGRALEIYDPAAHGPDYGFDPGAASAAYLAWVLWHMDRPEAAREMAAKALATAEAKAHAPTLAMVLSWLIFHAVCERDGDAIAAYNQRLQIVCAERECRYWQPFGAACAEWASFEDDRNAGHLELLLRYTGEFRERYFTSCLLLLGAEICLRTDRPEQGLELTGEAQRFIDRHSERLWQAEALRLSAQLRLRLSPGDTETARDLIQEAVRLADRQGAIALERRAAEVLADLNAQGATPLRSAS